MWSASRSPFDWDALTGSSFWTDSFRSSSHWADMPSSCACEAHDGKLPNCQNCSRPDSPHAWRCPCMSLQLLFGILMNFDELLYTLTIMSTSYMLGISGIKRTPAYSFLWANYSSCSWRHRLRASWHQLCIRPSMSAMGNRNLCCQVSVKICEIYIYIYIINIYIYI